MLALAEVYNRKCNKNAVSDKVENCRYADNITNTCDRNSCDKPDERNNDVCSIGYHKPSDTVFLKAGKTESCIESNNCKTDTKNTCHDIKGLESAEICIHSRSCEASAVMRTCEIHDRIDQIEHCICKQLEIDNKLEPVHRQLLYKSLIVELICVGLLGRAIVGLLRSCIVGLLRSSIVRLLGCNICRLGYGIYRLGNSINRLCCSCNRLSHRCLLYISTASAAKLGTFS